MLVMMMGLMLVCFVGAGFLAWLAIRTELPAPPALAGGVASERRNVQAFVSERPDAGMSMQEARELQDDVMSRMVDEDSVSARINQAARLMTAGMYVEAIDAYTAVGEDFPEELGEAQGQIGAAYFFLGEYETALHYYQLAKINGADHDMMDDNIAEVLEYLPDHVHVSHEEDEFDGESFDDDEGDDDDDDAWGGGEDE